MDDAIATAARYDHDRSRMVGGSGTGKSHEEGGWDEMKVVPFVF